MLIWRKKIHSCMEQKWENLLLAIAIAVLLTFFSALQQGIYENNTGEPPSTAALLMIIILFLGAISLLTIPFYFVIDYIRKKKFK